MAIASVYGYVYGVPFVSDYKAGSMLYELRPVMGYALLHGAIAGVWLFAAGLISGWYDNYSAVLEVPERVRASSALDELTDREREVVALVAAGLTNEEIAEHLVISPATARTHVSRAMVKVGARDRAQLVVLAYESGLVAPGRNG